MSSTEVAAAVENEDGQEITARFSRDELVRGWREREPRTPRAVPVVKIGAKTDLGRVRENNEDKFDFYEPDDPTLLAARGCFYAVADGMGGAAAGQIASELALKNTIAHYYDNVSDDIEAALVDAAARANETIHDLAIMIPERSGMGTTLTGLALVEDRAYVIQVGDSRAYLIRDGSIRQVSQDHSWVAEQVRMGGMTAEEAEMSPYRNIITRAIGTQDSVEPDIFQEEARVSDIWVLCSDGLTGHVDESEILRVVDDRSPTEIARQLVELANARGGRDNITVFVVSIRGLIPGEATVGTETQSESGSTEQEPRHRRKRLFGR